MMSLATSVLFTISIIDLAKKKRLFEANGEIKLHSERVSSLGGISIFSAFWITTCLFAEGFGQRTLAYLFVGSFLLFMTGVRDDMVGLPALQRLFIQIGVASLLFFGGIQLTHLPGIEGELPFVLSYLFTILLIGAVVNAFNFIDGINGLSGGLAVISSLAFAILFFLAEKSSFAVMALALAGGALGFLYFNFGKAKIFMGDNGSTFIGVLLSFLIVSYLSPGGQASAPEWISPAILASFIFVPLMDMIKVVMGRIMRGRSPFRGDLTHIHHLLSQQGLSARRACALLYSWNILVILFSFFFLPKNILLALGFILVIGGLPYVVLNLASRTKKQKKRGSFNAPKAGEYV